MRILMIHDQNRLLAPYEKLFEKHSLKYWEAPIDELQYTEIWQERQPNLLIVMLPINARESKLIQAFQTQTRCGVLACCNELDIPALETALDILPQAVLVHPVTEPQLMATLHWV